MVRTDIHRPSAVIPSDYSFVGIEHDKVVAFGIAQIQIVLENQARIRAHMTKTGGTYSGHEHGGNCHICGAHCIYTALFYHAKTNTYIRTGFDCAEKMHIGDQDLFRKYKDVVQAAIKARAGKMKAEGIMRGYPNLYPGWELYLDREDGRASYNKFEELTICDIMGKLVHYGSISDNQLAFVGRLLSQIKDREINQKKREEEKATAKDVPVGRLTIRVEVLKTKYQDSMYGETLKMLCKHLEDGYTIWGTVPSSVEIIDIADESGSQRGLHRGDVLELTGTFEPSKEDPKFGFFKRPSARLLAMAISH